jgi:hypothetical protein
VIFDRASRQHSMFICSLIIDNLRLLMIVDILTGGNRFSRQRGPTCFHAWSELSPSIQDRTAWVSSSVIRLAVHGKIQEYARTKEANTRCFHCGKIGCLPLASRKCPFRRHGCRDLR